jgi:hypothetical protein
LRARRTVTLVSNEAPPRSPAAAARRAGADPHEASVQPRAGREALRRHVNRLEQVRLAGAVGPDHERGARRKLEVEAAVRAVVAQEEAGDDQSVRGVRTRA